ncbi:MAG: hypothetical protein IJZ26_03895 [Clostridia bacterium]|nr:hypothetical protein [Clostridia bacterium]
METNYNDEKLADEQTMETMNRSFNRVKAQTVGKVKTLQTETVDMNNLATNIRQSGQYLDYLQRNNLNQDVSNFISQLQQLNDAELEELIQNYPSLSDFNRQNPNFPECPPRNFQQINRRFLQSELNVINQLFEAYETESRVEARAILSRIIKRRIEALQMLLTQNRNCLRNIWQYF